MAHRTRTGIPSGFINIDNRIDGFLPGETTVVTGNAGSGKTTLALNIGWNAALSYGQSVLIISPETSQRDLSERFLAFETGVNLTTIKHLERGTEEEVSLLRSSAERFRQLSCTMIGERNINLFDIREHCEEAVTNGTLDLVVIDALEMVVSPGATLAERITFALKSLHELATEFDIPFIVTMTDGTRVELGKLRSEGEDGIMKPVVHSVLTLEGHPALTLDGNPTGIRTVGLTIRKIPEGLVGHCRLTKYFEKSTLRDAYGNQPR